MCEDQLSHTPPKGTDQECAMRTRLAIKHLHLMEGQES